MKKVVLRSLVVALAVSYLGCKKSDSQGPTAPGTTENYFPNNEGTNYKFSYLAELILQVNSSRNHDLLDTVKENTHI